ncbi:thioredoxin [Rhodococcus phage MacGully]|nr:thioredoxin [Rhodococcus phage MacGully]
MTEEATQEYLEENVLQKESKPHIVYVTYADDLYRQHLVPALEEAVAAAKRKADFPVEMTIVLADGFGEGRAFAEKFQVLFMPAIFVFRRGEVVEMLGGFLPPEVLAERVAEACRPSSAELLHAEIVRQQQRSGD